MLQINKVKKIYNWCTYIYIYIYIIDSNKNIYVLPKLKLCTIILLGME